MISIKKGLFLFGGSLCTLWVAYQISLVQRVSSCVAYPVLQGYRIVADPIKRRWAHSQTHAQLSGKLSDLQGEVTDLRAQNIYLRATVAYLQNIKELRAFNTRYKKEGTIARVLARNFSEQSHFFYIDTGSQQNIEPDMVVIYKNNLLGKITDVYPWYSKVCLITDRLCKVAAYCASTKAHGIYEGANEDGCAALRYVSHLTDAKKGELVLSSGEGLVFPEGLALGRITTCQTNGLYKNITVTPLCDMKNVEYCTVVAKG